MYCILNATSGLQIFKTYVLPALIILAIAAVLAFLLAFLGEKLKVERDPVIDEIRSHLSGANCGGCGFAGCDAFAEALYKGKADVASCSPSSQEAKKAIAKLLGKDLDVNEPQMALVHCNGGLASQKDADYVGYKSCEYAAEVGGGLKCAVGCLGYGSCVDVCPVHAIEINDTGCALIDEDKCIACGLCIKKCPHNLIRFVPRTAPVFVACSNHCKGKDSMALCKNACVACGVCEKVCPTGAIKLVDNMAVIDYAKCNGCNTCVVKCPKLCIHILNEPSAASVPRN